ncbi:hypothetical protein TNCV_3829391 [Trichonephila clavipes]|nr:hypothetical protein TNCV_3829391 [Trichonephila clavipes]
MDKFSLALKPRRALWKATRDSRKNQYRPLKDPAKIAYSDADKSVACGIIIAKDHTTTVDLNLIHFHIIHNKIQSNITKSIHQSESAFDHYGLWQPPIPYYGDGTTPTEVITLTQLPIRKLPLATWERAVELKFHTQRKHEKLPPIGQGDPAIPRPPLAEGNLC